MSNNYNHQPGNVFQSGTNYGYNQGYPAPGYPPNGQPNGQPSSQPNGQPPTYPNGQPTGPYAAPPNPALNQQTQNRQAANQLREQIGARRAMIFGLGQQAREILMLLEKQMRQRWNDKILPTIALVIIEDKNTLEPAIKQGLLNENFITVPLDVPTKEDLPSFEKHISEWLPVEVKFLKDVQRRAAQNLEAAIDTSELDLDADDTYIPKPLPDTVSDPYLKSRAYQEDLNDLDETELAQYNRDRKAARWRGRLALLGGSVTNPTYALLRNAMNKAFTRVADNKNIERLNSLQLKDQVPSQFDAYVVASLNDPVVSGMIIDFAYLLNFYFQPGSTQEEGGRSRSYTKDDYERTRELGGGFLNDKQFFNPRAVLILPDFLSLEKVRDHQDAKTDDLDSYRSGESEDILDVQERAEASAYAFFRELDYYMDNSYNRVKYELTYTTSSNTTVIVRNLPPFQACYLVERANESSTLSREDVNYVVGAWLHQMSFGPLHSLFVAGEERSSQRLYRRVSAYSSLGLASFSLPVTPLGKYAGLSVTAYMLQGICDPPPRVPDGQVDRDTTSDGFFANRLELRTLMPAISPGLSLPPPSNQSLAIDPVEFSALSSLYPEILDENLNEVFKERTGWVLQEAAKVAQNKYSAVRQQILSRLQQEFNQRLNGAPSNSNWNVLLRADRFLADLEGRVRNEQHLAQSQLEPKEHSIQTNVVTAAYRRAQLHQSAKVIQEAPFGWPLILSGLLLGVLGYFVGFNLLIEAGLRSQNILLTVMGIVVLLFTFGWLGFGVWEVFWRMGRARRYLVGEYSQAFNSTVEKLVLNHILKVYEEVLAKIAEQRNQLKFFHEKLLQEHKFALNNLEDDSLRAELETLQYSPLQMDRSIIQAYMIPDLTKELMRVAPNADNNALRTAYSEMLDQFYRINGTLSDWFNEHDLDNPRSGPAGFGEALRNYCGSKLAEVANQLHIENMLTRNHPEQRIRDLEKLTSLSQPLWRINTGNLVPAPTDPVRYLGVESPSDSPSAQLLAQRGAQFTTFPSGDRHRLMLVQKQVGLPLFALTQLQQLRRSYNSFKGTARLRYLHTSRAHMALPDLMPLDDTDGDYEREWLERDPQLLTALARVFGLIDRRPHDPDGAMLYCYEYLERTELLRATDRRKVPTSIRWLKPTLAESCARLIDYPEWKQDILVNLRGLPPFQKNQLKVQANEIENYLANKDGRRWEQDDWVRIKLNLYLEEVYEQLNQLDGGRITGVIQTIKRQPTTRPTPTPNQPKSTTDSN